MTPWKRIGIGFGIGIGVRIALKGAKISHRRDGVLASSNAPSPDCPATENSAPPRTRSPQLPRLSPARGAPLPSQTPAPPRHVGPSPKGQLRRWFSVMHDHALPGG
ncbi:hypothetical protein HEK616_79880 (plasmid) [Streptomyces nigrescens]|uniref:Uncharacterized protein n=1 Tax=Streptomyces nigrescens TaxID=1920 RepID=A0ABM8A6Z4_STRNI|nr:hypothetical protein HEK616_79880 [Streptomyces nigrescens]